MKGAVKQKCSYIGKNKCNIETLKLKNVTAYEIRSEIILHNIFAIFKSLCILGRPDVRVDSFVLCFWYVSFSRFGRFLLSECWCSINQKFFIRLGGNIYVYILITFAQLLEKLVHFSAILQSMPTCWFCRSLVAAASVFRLTAA